MFIDSHAHLDFPEFENDLSETIERALAAGVKKIVNIGTTVETSKRVVEIARKFDCCWAAVGIHPNDSTEVSDEAINILRNLAKDSKVVAVGEVGLDFYRNRSPKEVQEKAFYRFLDLAEELNKPVVIHSRDATRETLQILEGRGKRLRGVMHCFGSGPETAQRYFDLGLLVSCAGQITFPNSEPLREKFRRIPVQKTLLETDCPFLAPQRWRGKRNEPSYIPEIAREFSALYNIPVEEVAEVTTSNAEKLFGI